MIEYKTDLKHINTLMGHVTGLKHAIMMDNKLHWITTEHLFEALMEINSYCTFGDKFEVLIKPLGEPDLDDDVDFDPNFGIEEVIVLVSHESRGSFVVKIRLDQHIISSWEIRTSPLEDEWLNEYADNVEWTYGVDDIGHFMMTMLV